MLIKRIVQINSKRAQLGIEDLIIKLLNWEHYPCVRVQRCRERPNRLVLQGANIGLKLKRLSVAQKYVTIPPEYGALLPIGARYSLQVHNNMLYVEALDVD